MSDDNVKAALRFDVATTARLMDVFAANRDLNPNSNYDLVEAWAKLRAADAAEVEARRLKMLEADAAELAKLKLDRAKANTRAAMGYPPDLRYMKGFPSQSASSYVQGYQEGYSTAKREDAKASAEFIKPRGRVAFPFLSPKN